MNYLKLNYPESEYGPKQYPQQLCDYLTERFFTQLGSLLDIGSGKGNHLIGFARNGFIVKGIDKETNSLLGFDIQECNLEKDILPFGDNTFDYVYSKSVIEHISNTPHFIQEIYRVLKPDGVVVCLTPDWGTDYKIFWDDPTHVKPFTKKGLQKAFELGDFIDVECERFYQLPFLWKHPSFRFVRYIISLLPDRFKWNGKIQRVLVRHSKEAMLLLSAKKQAMAYIGRSYTLATADFIKMVATNKQFEGGYIE